ncbi:putative chalcone-flavanone isomerase protein [Botrytis fragariae]|uniref:Putative chalcone-flavanone isomerase protein n=1 Tax=Botrytis fragariae TaxID=1964551 RepID=A0A8H6ATR8_9HELO|nr:putative chalcone-flavanone isomerase protein [Botrytis fragariae]KAF5873472.1 putative chalcone-flavanone isomerase protein [Botrytis fragariae]
MSFLPLTSRTLRTLPKRQCFSPLRTPTRTITSKAPSTPQLDPISLHRLEATRRAYYKRRTLYSASGFLVGMVCIWVTATSIEIPSPSKLDTSRSSNSLSSSTPVTILPPASSPSAIEKQKEEEELVPTGTSTIPTFPKTLHFSDAPSTSPPESYQLLGLGIRTVSFLHIQVYVLGLYISPSSIPTLQTSLLQLAAPNGASTLVANEKDALKAMLLDPSRSEEIWSAILKNPEIKSIVRIVPTRNTDFHHLRDAWVRSLTARAQKNREEFGDEAFGKAMGEFKALFNRGSVPKGRELLLSRDESGKLGVWYEDGVSGSQRLGEVRDERISRGIWLGYLAGANVSSEEARRSVVEGVMRFVERPVGSVEGMVRV